ncbi:hypothetical protein MNBD_GAMMA23-224 [hydrothermal vent metagenome]|uniref:Uncharacterized protein n=1 Tax=hydrothermal vent metagenome TaxID=652676 RepID=A0A3B1AHN2_9ZZZZ
MRLSLNYTRLLLAAFTLIVASALLPVIADDYNENFPKQTINDLRYGEALYNFYQSKYFSSLTNLMVADKQQPITKQGNEPELLKGGLFLAYGLHNQAHDVFTKLIAANLPIHIRDRTFYYLGKLFYKKSYYDRAVSALTSITTTLPSYFNDEKLHLLSNIYLRGKKFDKATQLLGQFSDNSEWAYYALYNIGVALIRDGKYEEGIDHLRQISSINAGTSEINALVDKANLAIGFAYIRNNQPDQAPDFLRQVRLEGPLSNKALLGIGWAYSSRDQHKKALRPWMALQTRDTIDTAVQESMLAIPYTLEQIKANTNALGHYQNAVALYDQELKSINSVINVVEDGELIASLSKVLKAEKEDNDFRLTTPPVSIATPYIEKLIAKHEFQQAYLNLRDLLFLEKILDRWTDQFPAYELMLEERQLRYQRKLPEIKNDTRINKIVALTSVKDKFSEKLTRIKAQKDIFALATEKEKKALEKLNRIEQALKNLNGSKEFEKQKQQFRILKGMMVWKLSREYVPRLWKAEKQLKLVKTALDETKTATKSIKQAWNSAPTRFAGFNEKIIEKKTRIIRLKTKLKHLMGQQQRFLVLMAMRELNNKQRALKHYHARARFSVARLYDKIALSSSKETEQQGDTQ